MLGRTSHTARFRVFVESHAGASLHIMEISDERLREFQDAYKTDFGEDISPDEARAMMQRLAVFYELVARPLPPDGEMECCRRLKIDPLVRGWGSNFDRRQQTA